jgi:glutamine cyclotransferase
MPRQRWAIPVFLACMHLVALPQRGEGGVDVPGKKGPKPLKRSNRITIDGDKVNYEHVTKNRSRLLITPYGAFRAPVQTAENAQMQSYFRHGKDTVGVEEKTPSAAPTPVFRPQLLGKIKHDISAMTKSIVYDPVPGLKRGLVGDGSSKRLTGSSYPDIIESTGSYSGSSLRRIDSRTGEIKFSRPLPGQFAEGICMLGNVLYVGQHKSNKVLLFNRLTFEPTTLAKEEKKAPAKGGGKAGGPKPKLSVSRQNSFLVLPPGGPITVRGMTYDRNKNVIYVSDGTETIFILDRMMHMLGTILVKDGDDLMRGMLELEYADGIVYANVEGRHAVARILIDTGDVVGWLYFDDGKESGARSAKTSENIIQTDFSKSSASFPELVKYTLDKSLDSSHKQMSGIAYHESRKMLMLAGQQWPFMYRISSKAGLSKEYAETKSRTWVQDHCWSPNKSYQKEMDSYERKRSGDTLWPSAHALRRFRDDIEESRKRVAEDSLLLKRAAAPPPVGTTPGPAKMKPPATGRLDLGNAGGSKVEVNDQFVLQYGFPMYEKELDFDGNPLHKLMKRYRPNGHRKSRKTRASTRLTAQTLKDQVEKQYRFT